VYPVLTGNDLVKAQKIYQEKFAQYDGLVEKRKADEAKLMEELKAKQTAYLEDIKTKKAEYEKELKKLELQLQMQQQNQLVSQFNSINTATKARRIFEISNFGVFNSDCPHAQPQGKTLTPIFVNVNTTILPDLIYLIEHTNKTVVSVGYENNYKFGYNPKNQYSIVAFLNNKLFICSKETFKVTTSKDSNKFNLNEMENSVGNISDFKKAIEI
jgi:ribosomal protein L9